MVLIVLEGADGGGKSTLLQRIKRKHNIKEIEVYDNGSRFKDERMVSLAEHKILSSIDFSKDTYLIDRWILSPLIYNAVFRGGNTQEERYIYNFRRFPHSKLIYCRAPLEVLRDRLKLRGEPSVYPLDKLGELLARYDGLVSKIKSSGVPCLTVDTTDTIENCQLKIEKFIFGESYE